ncbi:MAG: SDR family NAD(P)-dependent oxidoreductase [Bacteroidota bacterium]
MGSYVFITGASSGFGEACAEIFAENGYNLVLTARRKERLDILSASLKEKFGVEVVTSELDVREESSVKEVIQNLSEDVKSNIKVLINNAGLAAGRDPIESGLTSDWNQMIDTNVKGLLYVSQHVIPLLKKNGNSHIFNISSIAGKEVYVNGNVYCASKHAVEALSKAMRIELVEYGIKVTNIAPGAAETEFSLVRFKGDKSTANSVYQGFEPLQARDIAETIYFAATRPKHVTLNDIVIMPTAQANSTTLFKSLE